MRIGIEGQRLFRIQKYGMDMVALELIKNLILIDHENEYIIFVKPDEDNSCIPLAPNFKIVELKGGIYPCWEQLALPLAIKKEKIDILHCTSNTAPLFIKVPLLLTLHDIIFLESNSLLKKTGSMYQRFGNFYRRILIPLLIKRCERIITVSISESKRIKDYFNFKKNIEVIYNGFGCFFNADKKNDEFENLKLKHHLNDNYLLFLGNTDIKKNTPNVLKAYAGFISKSESEIKLVVVNLNEHDLLSVLNDINCQFIRKNIILTGYVIPNELSILMKNCLIFLVPSLRESFGIPILEAMASGVPVITSDTSSMPEIAGDAALLVNPFKVEEISSAIQVLVNDSQLRDNLINKGLERIKNFSWNLMAQKYLELYNRVYHEYYQ